MTGEGPLDWIRNSDPLILDRYAALWDTLGDGLEGIYQRYVNAVSNVEGEHWQGLAATAAYDRATADQTTIQTLTDQLSGVSAQARAGYSAIAEALRTARGYLADCDANGWSVSQQLLVTGEGNSRDLAQMNLDLTAAYNAAVAEDAAVRDTLNAARGPLADAFSSVGGLGAELGSNDGQQLATDPSQLTDVEIQRVIDAGQLTDEQLTALRSGNPVMLPVSQMDYLNQIARSLDGKSPEQINDIMNKLPPDARLALGNSLQLLSTSTVSTATKGDPTVPDQGGGSLLPDGIRDSLGEGKTLLVDAPGTPLVLPTNELQSTRALVDIVRASDPNYRMGSDLNKGLLEKGGDYLERSNRLQSFGSLDHPQASQVVKDIFTTVGDDKATVAAVISDGDEGKKFLQNVFTRQWDDDGAAAASLFTFGDNVTSVEDPNNAVDVKSAELAGNIMSTAGKFMADDEQWKQLMDLSGDNSESVGERNPALVRQLAASMSPYIGELAGGGDTEHRGFDIPAQGMTTWLDPDGNESYRGARNIFSLMNTDDEAGKSFIQAAAEEARANEVEFARDPDNPAMSNNLVVAGRVDGLIDGGLFDEANDRVDDKDQAAKDAYEKKEQWFNTGKSVTGIVVKRVPYVGDIGWDLADGQEDPIKESIIGPEPEPGERPQLTRTSDAFRVHSIISQADVPIELQQQYPDLFDNGSLKSWDEVSSGQARQVVQSVTNLRNVLDTLDGVHTDSRGLMNEAYDDAASGLPGRSDYSGDGGK
ncbi:TPR repeat region-containing protein [Nocardia otitidiscaviarum]|uniref:TPR repeat region-containing protein n=1 Tax=Nocardia otitidiscaviarum TaxID=1823 RepID=UPI00189354D9|nr:hypothetical protein [Nocardia otitidiscaviarum]MBF6183523.1 hypothetical protein [Nocardia otitidiscaviarum]